MTKTPETTSKDVAKKAARILPKIPVHRKTLDKLIPQLIELRHLLIDIESVAASALTQAKGKINGKN